MRNQHHLFQLLFLGSMLTAAAAGQNIAAPEPNEVPVSNGPGILRGFTVTEVSGSIGGYAFRAPDASGGIGPSSGLIDGTGSAEVGWFLPGERSDFFIRYRASYSGNDVYSALNGFDHTLALGWRKNITPRLTLELSGLADSVLYADYLFAPLSVLSAAGASGTIDQLSGSLTTAAAPGSSPLGYALFGARRVDLTSSATLTYLQSDRSIWKVSGTFLRSLPELDSSTRALSGSTPLLAVTDSRGGISYGYALSPRTTIGFTSNYDQIGSSLTQYQAGTGAFTIERRFTETFFVQGGVGGGVVNETPRGSVSRIYKTYVWNAGAGLKLRNETFVASVRRSVADSYGLGAASTITAELASIYHRPDSAWSFESSAGYERLSESLLGPVGGWLLESSASRRLTPRTRMVLQGVYGSDYTFTGVPRRGAKVSYIFTPGLTELAK